jgi:iron complex outermembrane receptor protein
MKKTILILLFFTGIVNAQNDSLKNIQVLNEVNVTGVRSDNSNPTPETTFKKEEITKNYFGQDFAILSKRTPGITFYSDGGSDNNGYMYFRLRGIDQTRINFTMNGVPITDMEDFGTYFSNFTDFLSNMSSFQIQRGTGVSTNGAASFGGQINFESSNLTDSAWNDVQINYGSFNSSRFSTAFNTGVKKNGFAAYGRYSNVSSDGYRYNSGTDANTFFASIGHYGKDNVLKLTAFTGRSKNQMSYLATSFDDIKKDARTNYLTKEERDDFRQTLIQLQYILKWNENLVMHNSLYYIGLQGNYDVLFSPTLYNYALFSDMFGLNSMFSYSKNNLKIRFGVSGYVYTRHHTMGIKPTETQRLYLNKGDKNEFTEFLKLSYDIKKITLFTDLQFRSVSFGYTSLSSTLKVEPITWQFFNPKAGINYKLNQNSSLFGSVGLMKREPTRNDMFAGFDDIDSTNYLLISDLTKVKPEQVIDFELGYKLQKQNFQLNTNLFWLEFKNEIAAIGQLSYIGLPLRKNVASSRRYGVELDYTWHITRNLSLQGNLTRMDAIIDSYTNDADLKTYNKVSHLLTPKWIINQGFTYSFCKNKILFTLNSRYISQSYLDNTNTTNLMVPDMFVFDSGLTFKAKNNLTLSIMCNNFTNEIVYNSGYSVMGTKYYFVGAPRNFYGTLVYKF